ncbi:MAG: SpoIID/LytB domain-containing protein [Planctomycetota bacterium]|jgi:stage II sporulation protein D|nr:SpoIID/LytB domain-containing protein [Planctomycetota bacterium]MDP7253531.1 SpoIID/LytB domain-containing protein [Planctomycetota bacterium]
MKNPAATIVSASLGAGLLIILFSCTGMTPTPRLKKENKIPPKLSSEALLLNGKEPDIRVSLFQAAPSGKIRLGSAGPVQINTLAGELIIEVPSIAESAVITTPAGFAIDGYPEFEADQVMLVPKNDSDLSVNGIRYHGRLRLRQRPDRRISAVNLVSLDTYLGGVLGSEVILSWPVATLQANAIASRSYALYQMLQRQNARADVASDTRDQVYRGMERESDRARSIIDQTRGIVLQHGGKMFPAYFSSTCGGYTTDARTGLDRKGWGPLSPVKCGFCRESRYFRWKYTVQKGEIAASLGRAGHNVSVIHDIRPVGRSVDGRAKTVQIVHSKGQLSLKATKFRHIMGTGKLRSTFFSAKVSGSDVVFSGNGWGHGVGLCQWGTKGMASAGYTAEFILNHYYPGAKLAKIY